MASQDNFAALDDFVDRDRESSDHEEQDDVPMEPNQLFPNEEDQDDDGEPLIRRPLELQNQYRQHLVALNAIAEAEHNFVETIGHLNSENQRLEKKIKEADSQNHLLQMQLQVLMKKMENLESFMVTLNSMNPENSETQASRAISSTTAQINHCPKCGHALPPVNRKDQSPEEYSDYKGTLMESFTGEEMILSDSFDEDEAQQSNPMNIDLVVEKVMTYLSTTDLLKARLICKTWLHVAGVQIERRVNFTLCFDNVEYLPRFNTAPKTALPLFTNVTLNLGFAVNPFRSHLEEFFEKYGPRMSRFSIYCDQEHPSHLYTEELRNVFLRNLRDLQELQLNIPSKITERQSLYEDVRPSSRFKFCRLHTLVLSHDDIVGDSRGYSVWVSKELLLMAPNLKKLHIQVRNKEVVTRILLALGDRECRAICAQLRHLTLDTILMAQHLHMLRQLNISGLHTLHICILGPDVESEALEAFLHQHRNTLTSLTLGDFQRRHGVTSDPLTVRLPVMSQLHSLTLLDPCYPDKRNLIFAPLSYAAQLPALNRLEFDHELGRPCGTQIFSDFFAGSSSTCDSLRELRVAQGLTEVAMVSQAARIFPNVQVLRVANVPDPVLRELWVNFQRIVHLELVFSPANINVDSVLTGIPPELCKRIQERNMYAQVDRLHVLELIRTDPSLCDLTELRTLKIDGLPSSLVTAVTGYLGFSQLKKLTSISIKADVATISRECRRILSQRLNLTLFEFF